MMKVGISFKEKEKELYDFLMNQISPSVYVKQLLKDKIDKEDNISKKNNFNGFDF